MHLIQLTADTTLTADTALCLGTFDGVHLGHQTLVRATVEAAQQAGLVPCAYTFDRPPASVLGHTHCVLLSTLEEKAALLGSYGIERVFYTPFDEQVAHCEAETFFDRVLRKQLRARHIVIGFHYRFGARARGDAALMKMLCAQTGLGLTVVEAVRDTAGELVSSTAIRQLLMAGDRARAEMMLNRALSEKEEALLGGRENDK